MKIETIDGAQSAIAAYKDGVQQAQQKKQSTENHGIDSVTHQVALSIRNDVLEESEKEFKDSKEQKDGQASEEQIKSAVSIANKKINKMDTTSLEFSYHEATNRVAIRVVDKDSKEVIREIPPEKSLDMLQKMWELAGIIVDERR